MQLSVSMKVKTEEEEERRKNFVASSRKSSNDQAIAIGKTRHRFVCVSLCPYNELVASMKRREEKA